MLKENYPYTFSLNGTTFTIRLMEGKDRNAILTLAHTLSPADLLFMRRDITQSEAVDDWLTDIERNHAITILVEDGGKIVAYATLYHHQLFWSRHMGEMRVMVTSPYRNRGLGARITRELMLFAKELELQKVAIYLAVEDKSAQRMVEELGFRPEALLTDWVKTRDDNTHDLLIMTTSLADLQG